MADPVRPLPAARRYEEIVDALEGAMHGGEFEPGDRLPSERELMVRFAAGRGSVREALFALQKMGLVALSPGERAYVTRPSAQKLVRELSGAARQLLASSEGVRQFQHARRIFECALAREAAGLATDDDIAALRAAYEANRDATTLERAIDTDVEFHFRIAQMSRNPVLMALHVAVGEWLREQRTTSVSVKGARYDATAAHKRILDAIAARDPDRAERAMRLHLEEVEAYYWRSSAARAAPARALRARR